MLTVPDDLPGQPPTDALELHQLLDVRRVDVDHTASRLGRIRGLRAEVLCRFRGPRHDAHCGNQQDDAERATTDHSRSSSGFGFPISTFTAVTPVLARHALHAAPDRPR